MLFTRTPILLKMCILKKALGKVMTKSQYCISSGGSQVLTSEKRAVRHGGGSPSVHFPITISQGLNSNLFFLLKSLSKKPGEKSPLQAIKLC